MYEFYRRFVGNMLGLVDGYVGCWVIRWIGIGIVIDGLTWVICYLLFFNLYIYIYLAISNRYIIFKFVYKICRIYDMIVEIFIFLLK